jgi:hypothetical protein
MSTADTNDQGQPVLEWLHETTATGEVGSDDIVALMQPLLMQVVATHQQGKVAPLNGIDQLRISLGHVWYANIHATEPANNMAAVRKLAKSASATQVDVTRRLRVEDGERLRDSATATREDTDKVAYYPDYVAWEQRLDHHDALTDTFVLGMLMASLATGLDFSDHDQLQDFVLARPDLCALNPRLSPVIAMLVRRMTSLERDRRPQDLSSVATALAHYRFQEVEESIADMPAPAEGDRRGMLLNRLRNRLYEISRRNRLIYYRETGSNANLTVGSVPHVLNVESIRLQQLLFTDESFCQQLGNGKPLQLYRWLRLEDYPFLATSLDRIRLQANRDAREYGFSQLRLVTAFLRWHNLKDAPDERINSPLVLVPATLRKRKGVRDSFELDTDPSAAEINPVLRHLLHDLYDIQLPETIDATSFAELEGLHQSLAQQLTRSHKGLELELVKVPRVQLIKRKALRRLDRYRRKIRKTGKGLKSYDGLSYSYSAQRYDPLGVQIFVRDVRPANAPDRDLLEMDPRHRVIEQMSPSAEVADIEREFYSIDQGEAKGATHWEIDLCSVSLANFSYRKMTLVRDYTELAANSDSAQLNFETLFSEETRARLEAPPLPPLAERYNVLPIDPSQQAAVLRGRSGQSYVIQGPPGTGKSQTIANLIVDYVARGQSVLFVCEKRAALDVVYHRLSQVGLADVCCLIHDTREDKKPFISALKSRYEQAIEQAPSADSESQRDKWLSEMQRQLARLETFSSAMLTPDEDQLTLRGLIGMWVERGAVEVAEHTDTLPDWAQFASAREQTSHLRELLLSDTGNDIFARSPLRYVSSSVIAQDDSAATLGRGCERALEALEQAQPDCDEISSLSGWSQPAWADIQAALDVARRIAPLAEADQLSVLDIDAPASAKLHRDLKKLEQLATAHQSTRDAAGGWPDDFVPDHLDQLAADARLREGRFFSFLFGGWRRARAIVKQHYRGAEKGVAKPLALLQARQEANTQWQLKCDALRESTGCDDLAECSALLNKVRSNRTDMSAVERDMIAVALDSDKGARAILKMIRLGRSVRQADDELAQILSDYQSLNTTALMSSLQELGDSGIAIDDYADALGSFATLPDKTRVAMRQIDKSFDELESMVLASSIGNRLRQSPAIARFNGDSLEKLVARIGKLAREGWQLNNDHALHQCAMKFHTHLNRAAEPMTNTTAEEKDWRRVYTRGRKVLEREFEKTRAYRSVRELFAGDSGPVLRDLRPVWLMSPLSVADALPLNETLFDVVIFDEASQIPLEDAIPTINRAQQMIVVGDDMQLPPTSFFSGRGSSDDDDDDGPTLPDVVQFDLNADSFLTRAAAALPGTLLAWHYRSRHESLIGFCNRAFYGGELNTIPTPRGLVSRPPIEIADIEAAEIDPHDILARPVSYHRLLDSPYESRRNSGEAAYIARLVRTLLLDESSNGKPPTIGIVAFSQAQQLEIERALEQLASGDRAFRTRLDLEEDREEDDQYVGLFVKNLENVQGDERDIVILSVCYGPNAKGRMLMNFGPINQNGGHKRLNVIFSRAKQNMVVVSSIDSEQITNTYNEGASALRQYLSYARAVSTGDPAAMQASLAEYGNVQRDSDDSTSARALQSQIADALQARGFEIETDFGQSGLRCHLAVRRPGDADFSLAVLLDDGAHYAIDDLQTRYTTNVSVLRAFGWTVVQVLAKDWYQDREQVIEKLLQAMPPS